MMTKKNYEALADALSTGDTLPGFEYVVSEVAKVLAADNPRFDSGKFFARVFEDLS